MNDICEALAETICSKNIVGPTPEQVSRLAAEIKRAINDWLEIEAIDQARADLNETYIAKFNE